VGRSSPSRWEGRRLLFRVRGEDRSPRPKGARAGGGVLREGQQAPSPPTRGSWVNAVSFPSGIRDAAQAAKKFSCILDAPDGLSWNLLEPSSGKAWTLAPFPLNPPTFLQQTN